MFRDDSRPVMLPLRPACCLVGCADVLTGVLLTLVSAAFLCRCCVVGLSTRVPHQGHQGLSGLCAPLCLRGILRPSPSQSRQQLGPWPLRPLGCHGGAGGRGPGAGGVWLWVERGTEQGVDGMLRAPSPLSSVHLDPTSRPQAWGIGRLQFVGAREPLGVGLGLLCVLSGALALISGRSAP